MKPQKKPNGNFYCEPMIDGKRKFINLGKIKLNEAKRIVSNIENILSYQKLGVELSPELITWIESLSSSFQKTLHDKGIIESRSVITFGELSRKFMAWYKTTDVEKSTILRMERSLRIAKVVLGKPICDEIAPEQVIKYEAALKKDLAESTWTKSLSDTKQCFRWGIDNELCRSNPIRNMKGGRNTNPDRMIYVDRDDIQDILDIASDDWKLIFALARFGGLRIPSELVRLRWEHIDFGESLFKAFAQKTKKPRMVPIFPPLEGILLDAWEALPERTPKRRHLIQADNRRRPESNLRTEAMKLIDRAGVDVWEKLFQNLRASFATDMINAGYNLTDIADWMGHSVAVLI